MLLTKKTTIIKNNNRTVKMEDDTERRISSVRRREIEIHPQEIRQSKNKQSGDEHHVLMFRLNEETIRQKNNAPT